MFLYSGENKSRVCFYIVVRTRVKYVFIVVRTRVEYVFSGENKSKVCIKW